MKKILFFLAVLMLVTALYAEERQAKADVSPVFGTDSAKKFNTQLKFGFGVDFNGNHGSTRIAKIFFYNQLGLSAGLDLNWKIFQKTGGDGAGELFLGLGFDFQYWVPTTKLDPEIYGGYATVTMHYMRLPVTLNIAYDFKADAGVLKRVGPLFSIGFNNNFYLFDYPHSYGNANDDYDDDEYHIDYDKTYGEINHWKISGTWALGLNFLFENDWFVRTSVGGDFGSSNYRSSLFYKYKDSKGAYGYFLYGHHEFMMFETGYRF